MYKAAFFNSMQITFKSAFCVLLKLITMLTNSALKGKDTGILIKAIFKGNTVLILFNLFYYVYNKNLK